uniref:NADH dehydrogenase subunit 3 n=1 Tax=Aularches miliaris TaxID=247159 RepID=UPI00286B4DB8|nr:NADH dehydrogenase subunit 3 [Aularches miliaris]WLG65249.1 NADH dehydrogenase subunit 3 [Aularches miliaris]
MLTLMTSFLMSTLLPIMVMFSAMMMSKKMINNREKNSPFECGFDPKSYSRMPFSIQFFLIAVIFMIFDIEIALIIPIVKILNISNLKIWLTSTMTFLFILLSGLYHEWNQGALKWAN